LQVASATLGIAHPPGYVAYVSLGHLLTRLPGLPPAYGVTLGCFAAGLGALILCGMLQVRLGASAWIGAALTLALAGHPRIWGNLIVPEVYAPTIALELGAACLLLRYLRRRNGRRLLGVGVLVGLALASRPPVLLVLPAFALALWVGWRRGHVGRGHRVRDATLGLVGVLLPCAYTLAYVYVRDAPETRWNTIEHFDTEFAGLPAADSGPMAKLERVAWLVTAAQFRGQLGGAGTDGFARLRTLVDRLGLTNDGWFVVAVCLVILGAVRMSRRDPAVAIALGGIMLGSAVFFCAYRVYDSAADVLPVLFAGTVFAGTAASSVFPAQLGWGRRAAAIGIFTAVCVWISCNLERGSAVAREADATDYVAGAELASVPDHALIFATWRKAPALCYGCCVDAGRPDVRIVPARPSRWATLAREAGSGPDGRRRPVFFAERITPPPGYTLKRWEQLWQLGTAGQSPEP
jgi:hypothetical protein